MLHIIVIIVRVIAAMVLNLVKRFEAAKAAKTDGLCNSCVNVYCVKGFGGKELIYCNYTSELRAIKFAVSECTGYRDKNVAPMARIVGFVRTDEIIAGEAFPATVVRIPRD